MSVTPSLRSIGYFTDELLQCPHPVARSNRFTSSSRFVTSLPYIIGMILIASAVPLFRRASVVALESAVSVQDIIDQPADSAGCKGWMAMKAQVVGVEISGGSHQTESSKNGYLRVLPSEHRDFLLLPFLQSPPFPKRCYTRFFAQRCFI